MNMKDAIEYLMKTVGKVTVIRDGKAYDYLMANYPDEYRRLEDVYSSYVTFFQK